MKPADAGGRLRIWGAALLVLASAAAGAGAQAQPVESGPAVLERGPLAVKGIPFFPPNVLPAYWAKYQLSDDAAEVWYTQQALVLPASWPKLRCGAWSLRQVPVDAGFAVCYAGPLQEGAAEVFLFFTFASAQPAAWCGWVDAFLQRFRYLLAFAQSGVEVPFPAVLEYRRK